MGSLNKGESRAVGSSYGFQNTVLRQVTGVIMANTAKVIKFPAQQPAQQENRMADLENGYLRLANQIQDALCFVELSGREFRVLNAIVRLTYGWSKKEDRITNSLIADKTRLAVKHVSEAVLSLAYRNIIKMRRIGQTRYIGINTLLDGWAYTKPKCAKCPVSFPVAEVVTQVITIPEIGDSKVTTKTIPKNGDNHPQNQGEVSLKTGNTKDILPKTNIKTDLTPIVPTGDEWENPLLMKLFRMNRKPILSGRFSRTGKQNITTCLQSWMTNGASASRPDWLKVSPQMNSAGQYPAPKVIHG